MPKETALTATAYSPVGLGLIAGADDGLSLFAVSVAVLISGAVAFGPLASILSGSWATSIACLALLFFGLPHGSLDVALMTGSDRRRRRRMLGLYIGAAMVMYGLWLVDPLAALLAFLALSIVHFAEDWDASESRILSVGMAAALLSAPAIAHRDALTALFTGLTGAASAAVVPQLLVMIVPVAFALAAVALGTLWQAGQRRSACDGLAALAAMAFLPPVIGFALFFCLSHSPRHLANGMRELGGNRWPLWRNAIVPLSTASFAIAVMIFLATPHVALATGVMATCFITLSVLTLPHMVVPMLLRATD